MGKNYTLKEIDEEVWKQIPEDIQSMVKGFYIVSNTISEIKYNIVTYQKRIKKLRTELRDYEEERNYLYETLYKFQANNLPSVRPTQQVNNNYQWSINLTINNVRRNKYLGSDKNVRKQLDEIKDVETYMMLKEKCRAEDGHEIVKVEIKKIIEKNLIKKIKPDPDGFFDKWINDELKMWDYFY